MIQKKSFLLKSNKHKGFARLRLVQSHFCRWWQLPRLPSWILYKRQAESAWGESLALSKHNVSWIEFEYEFNFVHFYLLRPQFACRIASPSIPARRIAKAWGGRKASRSRRFFIKAPRLGKETTFVGIKRWICLSLEQDLQEPRRNNIQRILEDFLLLFFIFPVLSWTNFNKTQESKLDDGWAVAVGANEIHDFDDSSLAGSKSKSLFEKLSSKAFLLSSLFAFCKVKWNANFRSRLPPPPSCNNVFFHFSRSAVNSLGWIFTAPGNHYM